MNTQSSQGIQIGIRGATGAYTLNGGTLISGFGEFGSPYSGSFTFGGLTTDSGAVDLNGFSFSSPIVIGNRSAGRNAAGALQNTNTSSTSVLDGAVSIGGENYVGGNGSIIFNSVVSGGLSNNYALYKQGAGTWTFANPANTFDGFY